MFRYIFKERAKRIVSLKRARIITIWSRPSTTFAKQIIQRPTVPHANRHSSAQKSRLAQYNAGNPPLAYLDQELGASA
jgi:hypothetical protein